MNLVRATFETRNFTFDAYGCTEAQALNNLSQGWEEHCKVYKGADPHYLAERLEEVEYQTFEEGGCYRDDEQIYIDPSRL